MSTLSQSERETPPVVRLSFGLLAFMALHVVMGPSFYEIRQLAVLHVFIVMIVAFWWAITPTKPIEWIAYAAAYICGGEILWRVTRVAGPVFFYEFAKYAIAALFIVALSGARPVQCPAERGADPVFRAPAAVGIHSAH